MATTPTNLPVPSESPFDTKFNAGKIDEFVTSDSEFYTDRLGNNHYTIEGINKLANQAMQSYGYITKKSFELGATLDTPNTVLQLEATGEYYRWDGSWSQPKVVPPGSTPESSGGVGPGKWVGVGDATVRNDINLGTVNYHDAPLDESLETLPLGKDIYDVFVIYGQSNAVGWAQDTPGFPSVIHRKALWFDVRNSSIKKIVKGMYYSSTQTSTGHAWASFANEYIKRTGRGVIIIPCAFGGSSVNDLSKPTTPANTLYDKMSASVTACIASMASNDYPIGNRYAIWNQGEQDANAGTGRVDYMNLFGKLITDMTSDFSLNKFFVSILGTPVIYAQEVRLNRIKQAQRDVCMSRVDTVICSTVQEKFTINNGLLQTTDNVHYTQYGYNLMGEECGRVISDFVNDNNYESNKGVETYGYISTTNRRKINHVYCKLHKGASSWVMYSENDTSLSYCAPGVDGIIDTTTAIQVVLSTGNPVIAGESVIVNNTMSLLDLYVVPTFVTVDQSAQRYAMAFQPHANITFLLSNTGTISVPNNAANLLAIVNACIQTSVSGGVVTVTYKNPTYHFPNATPYNGGSVTVAGATHNGFTISFTGTSGAYISLRSIPIPTAAVPEGCEFSMMYMIGSKVD